jgi:hypothetical protein
MALGDDVGSSEQVNPLVVGQTAEMLHAALRYGEQIAFDYGIMVDGDIPEADL